MGGAEIVTGAQDHYGRAELVTLGQGDGRDGRGTGGAPVLLDRRQVALIDAALRAEHPVRRLVLPASPFPHLPDAIADVLRSRPLTNAADGMLNRESLAEAATELGLEVLRIPRKADPLRLASEELGVAATEVESLVAAFGRAAGPPWRKDHKLAAAAALWGLARGSDG